MVPQYVHRLLTFLIFYPLLYDHTYLVHAFVIYSIDIKSILFKYSAFYNTVRKYRFTC